MPFHDRLAELYTIQRNRDLTHAELDEMARCLQANAIWVGKISRLENLSLIASMTDDVEWLHEICARMEELDPAAGLKMGKWRSKKVE